MGLFDTVEFKRYCPKCEAVTAWTAQFKWKHNCMNKFMNGDSLQKAFRHWKKGNWKNNEYEDLRKTSFIYREAPASCNICTKRYSLLMTGIIHDWLGKDWKEMPFDIRSDAIDKSLAAVNFTRSQFIKWDTDVIVKNGKISVSFREIPKPWRKTIEGRRQE